MCNQKDWMVFKKIQDNRFKYGSYLMKCELEWVGPLFAYARKAYSLPSIVLSELSGTGWSFLSLFKDGTKFLVFNANKNIFEDRLNSNPNPNPFSDTLVQQKKYFLKKLPSTKSVIIFFNQVAIHVLFDTLSTASGVASISKQKNLKKTFITIQYVLLIFK